MKLFNFSFHKRNKRNNRGYNVRSADNSVPVTTLGDLSGIFGGGDAAFSGSDEAAMRIATVYRCCDIVSSSVAMLDLQLLRSRKLNINGESISYMSVDSEMNLAEVLARPNDRMTSYQLKKNAVVQMLLKGNAYIYKWYSGGEVSKLILLSPDTCTYHKETDTYTVTDRINNIYGDKAADQIIHLRNMSVDGGYSGMSILDYAAKVLGIAVETDQQQEDTFKVGSTMRGFISGEGASTVGYGEVQDNQLETVTDRINYEMLGNKRIHYLPGSMKFIPIQLSPADLQIIDSKKWNCLDICRFFGVHPDKVFMQTSTNYKASQNSQTVFMTDTLQPLIKNIEAEFNMKLIAESLVTKLKIKFSVQDYYETDLTSKANYYQKMLQVGALTVNDIRMKEGLEPIENGWKPLVSANLKSLDSDFVDGNLGAGNEGND